MDPSNYLAQLQASQYQYQRQLGAMGQSPSLGVGVGKPPVSAQPVNSDNSEKLLLLLEDFE